MVKISISNSRPTEISGYAVATARSHEEAFQMVERLEEAGYPLSNIAIVGSNLRSVEQIRGRESALFAFGSGSMTGAWFGLFLGLMMSFSVPDGYRGTVIPVAFLAMALMGGSIRMIRYSLSANKRALRTRTYMIPTTYEIYVLENPSWARAQLSGMGGYAPAEAAANVAVPVAVPVTSPAEEAPHKPNSTVAENPQEASEESTEKPVEKPTEFGSRPDEKPKFGVRLSPEERARRLQEAQAQLQPPAPVETTPTNEDLQNLPPADHESFPGKDKNPFK